MVMIEFTGTSTGSDHIMEIVQTDGTRDGHNRFRLVVSGTGGDEVFFILWDDTTHEITVGTTVFNLNDQLNIWHMFEYSWCFGSTACETADDTVAIYHNGTELDSGTIAAWTVWSAASLAVATFDETGTGHAHYITVFAIADDDGVDYWDRYSGTCSDGITRCVDDDHCTGNCDNPPPTVIYPGDGT